MDFGTALRQFRRVDTPQSYLLIFDFDCVSIDNPRRAFHSLGTGQARHKDDEHDGDELHSRNAKLLRHILPFVSLRWPQPPAKGRYPAPPKNGGIIAASGAVSMFQAAFAALLPPRTQRSLPGVDSASTAGHDADDVQEWQVLVSYEPMA
jgi:hypothetical protein